MALGYTQVVEQFDKAGSFASKAELAAENLVEKLNEMSNVVEPPSLDPLDTAPTAPLSAPSAQSSILTPIQFIMPLEPSETVTAPVVDLETGEAPLPPELAEIYIPSLTVPTAPQAPTDTLEITLPDAPAVELPTVPALTQYVAPIDISIAYPTDPGQLDLGPRLLQPTAYSYVAGDKYSSTLLEGLKSVLHQRLSRSTGLSPTVEAELWARGADREAKAAQAAIAAVTGTAESRGLALPPGSLAAGLLEAQKDYYGKLSGLNREITIKQAELEQSNMKHTIEQGMSLESRLIEYANQIEQRMFEAAKVLADNAIAIYNANVEELRLMVQAYNANTETYNAQVAMQRARVEHYQARVGAYSAKVQAESVKTEQYKATVEASLAVLRVYEAQLSGQRALVDIEQAKVALFGERVKAYAAEVSVEVAKLELPKVQAQLNQVQADVFRSRVEGYSAASQVQLQTAKSQVEVYEAQIKALVTKYQGYATKVEAEKSRVQGVVAQNQNLIEQDKLAIQRDIAEYTQAVELFRAQVARYEASTRINMDRTRFASDQYFAIRGIAQEAAKVGAQTSAQLAASAFGTVQASARIGTDENVSFNFSGETSTDAMPA